MSDADHPSATERNLDIADRFRSAADLLEAQGASPFRVRAYRQGASTVAQLERPVDEVYASEGRSGLEALPNIGPALANAIEEILNTGQWRFLERLDGAVTPESVLKQVAGVGSALAGRIHETLGIESLEELERAAHDGRLTDVEGVGERRLQAIRESVESKLRRRGDARTDVPVDELLDVDAEYRRKAERGSLRHIAPRRFNPEGEAWLPILHTERNGRSFTALYSNTARAHELNKTDDWVVIYLEDGQRAQWTVVTETSGPLSGKRVVRGRETECRTYYDEQEAVD